MPLSIMIVDDEPRIRSSLTGLFEDEGFQVTSYGDGETALGQLMHHPVDLILLDVHLPGMDGLAVLQEIKRNYRDIEVIMISGEADIPMAVRATQLGAYNFQEKPLNPEKVLLDVQHVERSRAMHKEMHTLKQLVDIDYQMIGNSPAMQRLRRDIERAAPTDSRILITGKNGTGKELAAREIHQLSKRANKPFIKLNCAAIPRELIESELFGHERGAFTGAVKRKIGMFEEANGGTLFLDEIGDMALETQAKLLRVLQENEFQRVGGTGVISFDIRIISATNKRLSDEIAQGAFREDLYFRINVIPIDVPSLNERLTDIPMLVNHFLKAYSLRNDKKLKLLAPGALEPLLAYPWPGNIRELKNVIERLVIMTDSDEITAEAVLHILPGQYHATREVTNKNFGAEYTGSLRERLEQFEMNLLVAEFERVNGNVSRMAADLQTDRPNLHRKLKKYNIK
ncbi:sigma-54-dependent Fis family transcriptional regulator [candidate division KSB1 bacterium]|nr:sigma-54-dependent Fis family transcriptional regulator [candidate division KSB1 bacterium]